MCGKDAENMRGRERYFRMAEMRGKAVCEKVYRRISFGVGLAGYWGVETHNGVRLPDSYKQ